MRLLVDDSNAPAATATAVAAAATAAVDDDDEEEKANGLLCRLLTFGPGLFVVEVEEER